MAEVNSGNPLADPAGTGTEHLRPEQFKGHARTSSPGKHSKPYEGKRRAQYSPGKDIGGSVGASKKPAYSGRHTSPAEGKHGKAYDFDADAASSIGKGRGPDYAGRHRPKPKGEGKHGKAYDADRDIAQSMRSHKKDYVGKHSERYKPPKKKLELKGNVRFRVSRHEGKNKEHLKNLVK